MCHTVCVQSSETKQVMDENSPSVSWLKISVLILGEVTTAFGLVAVAGSLTVDLNLVKVVAPFLPTEYNAALGFILCGLGLLSIGFGSARVAIASGMAGFIGLLVVYFGIGLPTPELVVDSASPLSGAVVVVGLLTAFLLALAVHLAQTAWLYGKQAKSANEKLENQISERKRADEQVQHNLQRLVALREIFVAITSTLDRTAILHILLEKVEHLLASSAVSTVMLYNTESGLLDIHASRNVDEEEWKAHMSKNGTGLLDLVFKTRAPLVIRDVRTGPLGQDHEFFRKHGVVSYLGVPLVTKDEFLGVLSVYMKEEYQFSNEEVDFYSTLASQAAMAIYNSYLYEETRGLARELMTANKVKAEFLSVMSHELRTPLHVIMGHTGMVCDKMLGELNERQESSLIKVMSSSRELLSMISSILEATRMEAEAVTVEYREFSAEQFLSELQSSYNVPMDKDLALTWDYPSNLPVMNTDKGKLQQILQNLINNAIKFTEKGSVAISAKYLAETESVEFKVSDTGIGIPEKAVPLIFEKFRQIDSSDTRQYGGVGLGLYIIKQFTDLLGGTVRVESETGKGSTFVVTVPV